MVTKTNKPTKMSAKPPKVVAAAIKTDCKSTETAPRENGSITVRNAIGDAALEDLIEACEKRVEERRAQWQAQIDTGAFSGGGLLGYIPGKPALMPPMESSPLRALANDASLAYFVAQKHGRSHFEVLQMGAQYLGDNGGLFGSADTYYVRMTVVNFAYFVQANEAQSESLQMSSELLSKWQKAESLVSARNKTDAAKREAFTATTQPLGQEAKAQQGRIRRKAFADTWKAVRSDSRFLTDESIEVEVIFRLDQAGTRTAENSKIDSDWIRRIRDKAFKENES
jgi:hypothetical protein